MKKIKISTTYNPIVLVVGPTNNIFIQTAPKSRDTHAAGAKVHGAQTTGTKVFGRQKAGARVFGRPNDSA